MKLSKIIECTNGEPIGEFRDYEINDFVTDTRKMVANSLYIPLIGENFDAHMFISDALEMGAIATLTSKDIAPIDGKVIIKVADTLKAFQNIAKYQRETTKIPLVAITGSVGKTTTKDMIASVLDRKFRVLKTEGNLNNFVGVPTTILKYHDEEIITLEMGMNHFGEISVLTDIAKPDVAVLSNIGHAHIGILGSKENILKAKMEIVEGMSSDGIIIINNDDALLTTIKGTVKQKVVTVGIKNKSDYMAYDIKIKENSTSFKIKNDDKVYEIEIPLVGEHFVYNALLAWAVGITEKVKPEEIVTGIAEFKLSKMRMDIIKRDNFKIINDTYNAGPESTKAALTALKKMDGGKKIAILADILELGEFSSKLHFELGEFTANLDLDYLLTVGSEAKQIAKGAIDAGMKSEKVCVCDSREAAVQKAKEIISDDAIVLVKGSHAMKMHEVVEKL